VQAPTLAPVRTSGLNSPPRARRPSPESCGARAMIFEVVARGQVTRHGGHARSRPSWAGKRRSPWPGAILPEPQGRYTDREVHAGDGSGVFKLGVACHGSRIAEEPAHPSQLLRTGGVWSASQILPKKRLAAGSEGAARFLKK
jgi:hypothetical protein